ncbi:MAG: hypothetical protein DRP01_02585 [Archaeoglobales archaeon]|nr:MAG: hypothetical protein DRP01_02585 [Archaeoglobales archaeon]
MKRGREMKRPYTPKELDISKFRYGLERRDELRLKALAGISPGISLAQIMRLFIGETHQLNWFLVWKALRNLLKRGEIEIYWEEGEE